MATRGRLNIRRHVPAIQRELGAMLFAAGNMVQVEAQNLITQGAVSGKGHVPSAPGEPPNNDTRVLANNIETVQLEPLKVEVSSNAPYSVPLEYGFSDMEARPFMGPAAHIVRPQAKRLYKQIIRRAVR